MGPAHQRRGLCRRGYTKLHFSTDNCEFLSEEIISAQNFKFASKFFRKLGIYREDLYILEQNFLTRKTFLTN